MKTDVDLVSTLFKMKYFTPPEGVEVALVFRSKPGVCQASVEMWCPAGRDLREYRFCEPPSEDTLRMLYRDALDLLAAANVPRVAEEAPASVGTVLGMDLATLGGDGGGP